MMQRALWMRGCLPLLLIAVVSADNGCWTSQDFELTAGMTPEQIASAFEALRMAQVATLRDECEEVNAWAEHEPILQHEFTIGDDGKTISALSLRVWLPFESVDSWAKATLKGGGVGLYLMFVDGALQSAYRIRYPIKASGRERVELVRSASAIPPDCIAAVVADELNVARRRGAAAASEQAEQVQAWKDTQPDEIIGAMQAQADRFVDQLISLADARARLRGKYNALDVSIGLTTLEVAERLGEPSLRLEGEDRLLCVYGEETAAKAHPMGLRGLPWVAVVFVEGRVAEVFSDDFFDVRLLESMQAG